MPTNGETFGGDVVALLAPKIFSGNESLPAERCLDISTASWRGPAPWKSG